MSVRRTVNLTKNYNIGEKTQLMKGYNNFQFAKAILKCGH